MIDKKGGDLLGRGSPGRRPRPREARIRRGYLDQWGYLGGNLGRQPFRNNFAGGATVATYSLTKEDIIYISNRGYTYAHA
jgi:hypothetical protein